MSSSLVFKLTSLKVVPDNSTVNHSKVNQKYMYSV